MISLTWSQYSSGNNYMYVRVVVDSSQKIILGYCFSVSAVIDRRCEYVRLPPLSAGQHLIQIEAAYYLNAANWEFEDGRMMVIQGI